MTRPACGALSLRLDPFFHIDARTFNDVQANHIILIWGHRQFLAIMELFGSQTSAETHNHETIGWRSIERRKWLEDLLMRTSLEVFIDQIRLTS